MDILGAFFFVRRAAVPDGETIEMTVIAAVRVILADKEPWERGNFEFVQLPAPGDCFTILERGGAEDDMRVLYVEHIPVRSPQESGRENCPTATVVVEWLSGRDNSRP